MSIRNAVLIISKTRPIWRVAAGSNAVWGRIEDTTSVGEVDDVGTVNAIGDEWLRPRSGPAVSHVYRSIDTGDAVGGVDYKEGDRLADPDLRVQEIAFDVREDGKFRSTPALSSKYDQQLRRHTRRLERLVRENGGSAATSTPAANVGSDIAAGKLQPRQIAVWSWYDELDLDPIIGSDDEENPWQKQTIDAPVRIAELVVECNHRDEDFDVITTGVTRFRLFINGVAPLTPPALGSVPLDVVVAANSDRAAVSVYGQTILNKGDTVSVAPITNGGHIRGSVTMFGSDVI